MNQIQAEITRQEQGLAAHPGDAGGWLLLGRLFRRNNMATNEEEYIAAAVGLARSPERLAQYRASIRPRIEASYLMDYDGFVADMEAAYRLMWLNYLRKQTHYLDTATPVEQALAEYAAARQPAAALAA